MNSPQHEQQISEVDLASLSERLKIKIEDHKEDVFSYLGQHGEAKKTNTFYTAEESKDNRKVITLAAYRGENLLGTPQLIDASALNEPDLSKSELRDSRDVLKEDSDRLRAKRAYETAYDQLQRARVTNLRAAAESCKTEQLADILDLTVRSVDFVSRGAVFEALAERNEDKIRSRILTNLKSETLKGLGAIAQPDTGIRKNQDLYDFLGDKMGVAISQDDRLFPHLANAFTLTGTANSFYVSGNPSQKKEGRIAAYDSVGNLLKIRGTNQTSFSSEAHFPSELLPDISNKLSGLQEARHPKLFKFARDVDKDVFRVTPCDLQGNRTGDTFPVPRAAVPQAGVGETIDELSPCDDTYSTLGLLNMIITSDYERSTGTAQQTKPESERWSFTKEDQANIADTLTLCAENALYYGRTSTIRPLFERVKSGDLPEPAQTQVLSSLLKYGEKPIVRNTFQMVCNDIQDFFHSMDPKKRYASLIRTALAGDIDTRDYEPNPVSRILDVFVNTPDENAPDTRTTNTIFSTIFEKLPEDTLTNLRDTYPEGSLLPTKTQQLMQQELHKKMQVSEVEINGKKGTYYYLPGVTGIAQDGYDGKGKKFSKIEVEGRTYRIRSDIHSLQQCVAFATGYDKERAESDPLEELPKEVSVVVDFEGIGMGKRDLEAAGKAACETAVNNLHHERTKTSSKSADDLARLQSTLDNAQRKTTGQKREESPHKTYGSKTAGVIIKR